MENLLTQAQADFLKGVEKHCATTESFHFPRRSEKISIPLQTPNGKEKFSLDVGRGGIVLAKCKFQTRARSSIILVRVDLAGPGHENPDGVKIPCPHIHLYREGWGDKWAEALPEQFTAPADLWQTLLDFYIYCNVTRQPIMQQEMLA